VPPLLSGKLPGISFPLLDRRRIDVGWVGFPCEVEEKRNNELGYEFRNPRRLDVRRKVSGLTGGFGGS